MKIQAFVAGAAMAFGLAAIGATSAQADPPLPPAGAFTNASGVVLNGLGIVTNNDSPFGSYSETSITSYSDGTLNINNSGSADGTGLGAIIFTTAQFYFTLTGPNSIQVPLFLEADGSTSIAGNGVSEAAISVDGAFNLDARSCGGFEVSSCIRSDGSIIPVSFSGSYFIGDYVAGSACCDIVQLSADVNTSGISGGVASIDPMIIIDPTFLADNPGYTLSFSPNPVGGVTEPATWAMMLLGFALAGGGLRVAHRHGARRAV